MMSIKLQHTQPFKHKITILDIFSHFKFQQIGSTNMNNEDFSEALRFQKLGLYPQAFDLFFSIESAGLERSFRKCCEMAWSSQLQERQLDRLIYDLDQEVKRKNGTAIYNYGLVMEYQKDIKKATELLKFADELKVPEARNALMRILLVK